MVTLVNRSLTAEIAQLCHTFGIGVFGGTEATRTIFVGTLPETAHEAIWLVDVPSPAPHQYIDTEYQVIDFWARSPHTDRSKALLQMVFDNLHRRHHYTTANWSIHFSQALGSIQDVDRDSEGGKLFRLSIQFICRNLNNVS